MTGKLDGKVALITGAGSGMGRAASLLFAQEGAKVAAVDWVEETSKETAEMIKQAGGDAISITADVSRWEDIDNAVKTTVEKFGKLDIMVNNAGVFDGFKPLLDVDEALWDKIINTNLKGYFYGCKRAVQQFLAQGKGGVILNTASVAGTGAMAGGTAYTVSKHGVVGLTKQVACEYASANIRVNAVCPGGVVTGMTKDLFKDPKIEQMVKQLSPMGRAAQPEELARGMLYMVSDDASFVTGSLLTIDGGWRAK